MYLEDSISIKTEDTLTGNDFRQEDFPLEIPNTAGTHSRMICFPYNVNIIRGLSFDLENLKDDIVSMTVGNNDPVGLILLDAVIGDSTFNVTKTVTDNLDIGYNITLAGQDLGEIINYTEDFENDVYTITTENSLTADVSAMNVILFTYYMVKNKRYYGTNQEFRIEGSTMHSFIPQGQKIYINITTDKTEARVLPITLERLTGLKIDE